MKSKIKNFIEKLRDKKIKQLQEEKKKLIEELNKIKKEFEEWKRQNRVVVKDKTIWKGIILISVIVLFVSIILWLITFIYALVPLISFALLLPSLILFILLIVILQIPWVKTLLSYYFSTKKLVLVFNPDKKTLSLKAWIEKDKILYNEKGLPILIDDDSIYIIAKGHYCYLYLDQHPKTFGFRNIAYIVEDEQQQRKIVYPNVPSIALTTKDIEKLIKQIELMIFGKELKIMEEKSGKVLSIGGLKIPVWLIFVIIIMVFAGLMIVKAFLG